MRISKNFCRLFIPGFLFASPTVLFGNPTGGTVSGGAATFSGQNSANLSVHQTSNTAVINWQSFSVNSGETTQFLMPSVQSSVLNRVTGGSVSTINGQLFANGHLYLINQNGIIVGPHGLINAASFTGSTRDIADSDYVKGKLHFVGHGSGTVTNQGTINAGLGDVSLIGKAVDNQGNINALKGRAVLVAGDDVLLAQKNADGSSVVVNTSPLATTVSNTTVGVSNSGTINATSAELKASGGNIYALAIKNSGTIRASTVKKQGGRIYLKANGGSLVNSGTLNANATVAKGTGGRVILKNTGGSTTNSGLITATGGAGGTGGYAEISGSSIYLDGRVDLSAKGGKGGTFFIDPTDLTIVTGTTLGYINGSGSNYPTTANTVSNYYVNMALNYGTDVTLSATNSITVNAPITWYTTSTLLFDSAVSQVAIKDTITATSGGTLEFNLPSFSALITQSAAGAIDVSRFILKSGTWYQNTPSLPGFTASNFYIAPGAVFLRVTGGGGSPSNPYLISDIYGLQGIGSSGPGGLLNDSFALTQDINAGGTSSWNYGSSRGFVPIGNKGNFTGSFNGNGHTISGLYIGSFVDSNVALFANDGSGSTIADLNLSGGSFSGYGLGSIVGINRGIVSNCTSSAHIEAGGDGPASNCGGLVGLNYGTVTNSSFYGTMSVYATNAGGVVGNNVGTVSNCYSTGLVQGIIGNPSHPYSNNIGGLVGLNSGTISQCYSTGEVIGKTNVGGLVGLNNGTITESYSTGTVSVYSGIGGGLVGQNGSSGVIQDTYATGDVVSGTGTDLGGLVGYNAGSITTSYAANDISGGTTIGGVVGYNTGTVTNSFWMGSADTGIGNPASDDGATSESLSELQDQSTFQPAGTGSGYWDFTEGGVWAIIPGVNNGMPVFQWQYGPSSGSAYSLYPLPINTPLPDYPDPLGVSTYLPPTDTDDGFDPGDPIDEMQDQTTVVTGDDGDANLSVTNSITGVINDNGTVDYHQTLIVPGQAFGFNGGTVPPLVQGLLGQILDGSAHDDLQSAIAGGGTTSAEHLIKHKEQELILHGHYYTFHDESVPNSVRTQLDFMLSPQVRDFLEKAAEQGHP